MRSINVTMDSVYSTNIESATEVNHMYRQILYTDATSQLVLMSVNPGEDIHWEAHTGSQFFRIESGHGTLTTKNPKRIHAFTARKNLKPGLALIVPANTWHYVKNTGKVPLKLYTIYSPPQHDPMDNSERQPTQE